MIKNIVCIVIILIISIIYLIIINNLSNQIRFNKLKIDELSQQNLKTKRENLALKENIKNYLLPNIECFNQDFYNVNKDKLSINSLFQDGNERVLICRISESFCSTCNQYVIQLLKELKFDNVIILCSVNSRRGLINIIETYNIENRYIYSCNDSILSIEIKQFPYFFVLNILGEVENVYIPFENNFEQDKEMLSYIIQNL